MMMRWFKTAMLGALLAVTASVTAAIPTDIYPTRVVQTNGTQKTGLGQVLIVYNVVDIWNPFFDEDFAIAFSTINGEQPLSAAAEVTTPVDPYTFTDIGENLAFFANVSEPRNCGEVKQLFVAPVSSDGVLGELHLVTISSYQALINDATPFDLKIPKLPDLPGRTITFDGDDDGTDSSYFGNPELAPYARNWNAGTGPNIEKPQAMIVVQTVTDDGESFLFDSNGRYVIGLLNTNFSSYEASMRVSYSHLELGPTEPSSTES